MFLIECWHVKPSMSVHLLLADQSPPDGVGSNCGCANFMGGIAAVGLFLFPCQKCKTNTTPNYGSPIQNK